MGAEFNTMLLNLYVLEILTNSKHYYMCNVTCVFLLKHLKSNYGSVGIFFSVLTIDFSS